MKKICYIAMLAILTACSGTGSEDRPTLSVSIEPQRKILEEIAGDRYEVVTVLASGANPETYDPSMAQRVAVDKSELYFTTGYMPFEQSIANTIDKAKVIDTSCGIQPVKGTHSHGDGETHEAETDPHVWTSIRNASIMAKNMYTALANLDPDHADEYASRYTSLAQRLDSLDAVTAQKLTEAGAHAFVVWHPSLSYYARDYRLHQIAVGYESKEQSIGSLRDIINEAREDSAKVFFFQKEYDNRQAESLNKEMQTRLVIINPLAYDWEKEIEEITNELTR